MTSDANAWVLFDGACGFCNRWVAFWARLLRTHRVGTLPLQDPWVAERLGLAGPRLLDDLRVWESGGRMHRGPEAYRFVFRRIPVAGPFDVISRIPLARRAFDAGYRWFCRNRYRFSRACRRPAPMDVPPAQDAAAGNGPKEKP